MSGVEQLIGGKLKTDKFTKQLKSLSKKIELAKYDSMLNADIAKEFAQFKKMLLAQMSFMSHRWAIVKRYPKNHAEYVEIKADCLTTAMEMAVAALDDKDVVRVELFCDGRKLDEV